MAGEVKETANKTAPSAAITEKRANRLGGCVGIFFQLFDWNRRFAKRKLFSRKSLLPGKQASKRFGGNEKMPKSKLNLIADENRGGFPNLKRSEVVESKKHEMRSPGLVARLMGLESMPSIHRDKPKKKFSLSQSDKRIQEDELLGKCNVFSSSREEEDLGFEKSRPQKIQKTTGVCDRRVVKKFGSDALQIKNVLTRVRKNHQYSHQHQKLASPVRSPRLHRKSSRLIDAAARILEPGLQAKKSGKCAIAYPGSRRCGSVGKDPVEVVSPDSSEFEHGYNLASCNNCGSLVDVVGSSLVLEERGNNMVQDPELSSFCRKESNASWGNQEPSVFVATKGMRSDWLADANHLERKALRSESHDFSGKHHKDETVSSGFRNRNNFHNQVLQKEQFPPEARVHTLQSKRSCSSTAVNPKAKGFVPMNRGSTYRNRPGVPSKTEISELNLQRRPHTRFEDSSKSGLSSPARKRRMSCVNEQGQGAVFTYPTSRKSDVHATGACSSASGRRGNDFAPLKLGSPSKGSSRSCRDAKERIGIRCVSDQTVERYSKRPYQKRLPLDADTVGLLLHQKLKELASQHKDETGGGGASQSKSTSVILQELMSSLALEQLVLEDADMPYAEKAYRSKGKTEVGSFLGYAHNSDYTSPGSVLDASFSNESCFSSSFDNSSGQIRLPLEPTEDLDLLDDSATSNKKPTSSNFQAITNLINHVSHVLHGLSSMGLISTQSRFIMARDAIIQTELLFGSFGTQEEFLICPTLVDELMIHAACSKNLAKLPGLTGGFLVDAMIEFLELRYYYGCIFSGFKQWRTLPLCVNSDGLVQEVLEEVTKWTQMTGMYLDDIISIDIEKWQDFETDMSELGIEIAYEIFCSLVGELAVDLGKCLLENHLH